MKRLQVCCALAFLVLFATVVPLRARAGSTVPHAGKEPAVAGVKLPADVDIYARARLGDGEWCLVGAKSDRDGMDERPVVYLIGAGSRLVWHRQLPIPKDYYQGRATHCVASRRMLYVLVQMDTDSEQSTSQTVLRAVQLRRKCGATVASKDLDVPGVAAAYTAWVDEGGGNFALAGGKLVVKGQYDLMSERDHPTGKAPTPFRIELPSSLGSRGGAR
ncbi:hypothetical protein [Dyella sp. A6]|uniref:hypothetical protein n=1 Tax=Dyella aluminiiresistens TaxID=3069105 RepID=UPI002E7997FE|nr:hypothetical protein [Dyella sp. A6]